MCAEVRHTPFRACTAIPTDVATLRRPEVISDFTLPGSLPTARERSGPLPFSLRRLFHEHNLLVIRDDGIPPTLALDHESNHIQSKRLEPKEPNQF